MELRHKEALKMEGSVWERLWRRVRGRGQGEGSRPAAGKRASCLFKKRQTAQTASGLRGSGYANEVSAGWLALNGAARDWLAAVGEGLGVDDSWDRVSQEREEKKKSEGERGRQADTLHNARLGPVLVCVVFSSSSISVCV